MMETIYLMLTILGYACLVVFAITGLLTWLVIFFYYFIFQPDKKEIEYERCSRN